MIKGVRGWLVGDSCVADLAADLSDPHAPERVIAAAVESFGRVHALVCNQALSGFDGAIGDRTATDLDRHWAVDTRASILLALVTLTVAEQLANRGIRVNTVNPAPVDTGYLGQEARRSLAPMFPFGRLGTPEDAARLVAWLVTDEAAWITGQTLHREGGFGRWRPRGG